MYLIRFLVRVFKVLRHSLCFVLGCLDYHQLSSKDARVGHRTPTCYSDTIAIVVDEKSVVSAVSVLVVKESNRGQAMLVMYFFWVWNDFGPGNEF